MGEAKRKILAIAVIFTVFIIKLYSASVNHYLLNDKSIPHFYFSIIGQVLYYLIPVLAILLLFHKPYTLLSELGLANGFLKGFSAAFLFTLPMLIGYFLMGNYSNEYSFIRNLMFACKDGFREEIFYRAFLFGQLFRHAKWGFIPAVAINGLVFGVSHLYQAHSIGDSIIVFVLTFGGAIWFAWLFIEWKENIWLPVFLHILMNFYWDIFSAERTVAGGLLLNLPRMLTILITIYFTVKFNRKYMGTLKVNKKNLFRWRM